MPQTCLYAGTTILQLGATTTTFPYDGEVNMGSYRDAWYQKLGYYEKGSSFVPPAQPAASISVGVNATLATSMGGTQNVTARSGTAYTVAVQSANGSQGSVSGGGTFLSGASVTVVATPAAHYKIVSWTVGGSVVSTSASYTFSVSADVTVVANFTRSDYLVTVASGANGVAYFGASGTATSGYVIIGQATTIRAIPNANFSFVSWSASTGTPPSGVTATYTPTADVTVTASFSQSGWTLTCTQNNDAITGLPNGRVYQGESGTVASASYASGAQVIIRLVYDNATVAFSAFVTTPSGITLTPRGDAYPDQYLVTTQAQNIEVKGFFYKREYQLTVGNVSPTYGSVKIMLDGVDKGLTTKVLHSQTAVLVATPTATETVHGKVLGWWRIDSNGVAITPKVTAEAEYTVPEDWFSNQTYKANFAEATEVTVATVVEDADAVTAGCVVTLSRASHDGTNWYEGPITATAVAAQGWYLAQWDYVVGGVAQPSIQVGDVGFSNTLAITLTANTTITATFGVNTFVVGYAVDAASPAGSAITATWGLNSTANSGAYDGNTGLEYGHWVKLVAVPTGTDVVRGWFKDGTQVTASATLDIQVSENANYVAKFGNTVAVSVNGADAALGTAVVALEPGGTGAASYAFTYGESVRISAVPASGKFFEKWVEGSTVRNDLAAIAVFAPTGALTLVAHFDSSALPVYLKLSNGANSGLGALSFTPAAGITATELTAAAFDSALDAIFTPHVVDPLAPLSGGLSGADTYWRLSTVGDITLDCIVLAENATFVKWQIAYIADGATYWGAGAAVDLATAVDAVVPISTHCVVTAAYESSAPIKVTAAYASGSNASMGGLDISPIGANYVVGPPIQCDLHSGDSFTVGAIPINGYKFEGWFPSAAATGTATSTSPYFTQTLSLSGSVNTLYAKFAQDANAVYLWEGDTTNKMLIWRSKRFVSTRPVNFSAARVLADGYDVKLNVFSSSSPDAPAVDGATTTLTIGAQEARRLPRMRPEKCIEVEVQSQYPVSGVAISTAMEGLIS